jgi:hypothetical protein
MTPDLFTAPPASPWYAFDDLVRCSLYLLIFAGSSGCGETVAEVRLPSLGAVAEAPVAAPADTWLGFAVHLDRYDYVGRNYVLVDAELLRDGAVVASTQCRGFEFEGGAGSGCQTTEHARACGVTVPEGGVDTVRLSARLESGNTAHVEGLSVRVVR